MFAKYRHHRKTMLPTHYGKFSRSSKISLLSPLQGAMPSASKPVRRYRRNSRFYAFAYIFRFGFTLARWPFRSSFRVGFAARVRVPRALMARGAAAICAASISSQTPKHPAYQWRDSRPFWFWVSWPRIALVIYLKAVAALRLHGVPPYPNASIPQKCKSPPRRAF